MNVVVVESPSKAKTINKYLGPGYKVLASFGHVRDLPAKDGSVLPDDDFSMLWEVDTKSAKHMKDISDALKTADSLILATDPDREGEAISWHVLDLLNKKKLVAGKPVRRVVFNAITKKAVLDAMANPRDIDIPLVDAYLARRALDYLVGFNLSPVLWRKLPGARSAGRVQSVTLRLVCDREAEIERFVAEEYWNLSALLKTPRGDEFEARLVSTNGTRLPPRGVTNGEDAGKLKTLLEGAAYTVDSIEAKPVKRNPSPPFTTSTLQQAASSKLGFSASRTMQVAQKLYEGVDLGGETVGLITYMRTDGVQMAAEAIDAARSAIGDQFGSRYVPDKARFYSTKAKNAQEAHEAIRPTDFTRTPEQVRKFLDARPAAPLRPDLEARHRQPDGVGRNRTHNRRDHRRQQGREGWPAGRWPRSSVSMVSSRPIPMPRKMASKVTATTRMAACRKSTPAKTSPSRRSTRPSTSPSRHRAISEASLIKKMEELGIGRPSTYAATRDDAA